MLGQGRYSFEQVSDWVGDIDKGPKRMSCTAVWEEDPWLKDWHAQRPWGESMPNTLAKQRGGWCDRQEVSVGERVQEVGQGRHVE